jgi:hypothetical protein
VILLRQSNKDLFMKDLAKGLAALGRNGDSTLVHMHPGEVAGLQALAKSQGTTLTINPDTGLPEAFNLMNAFTSLLPTAVGFMLGGPAGASMGSGWATMAPIVGGALTGAAIAGAKGEDPLMGGLTGGFGGYGGAGLANKVSALGTAPVQNATGSWQAAAANTPSGSELFMPPTPTPAPMMPSAPYTNAAGVPTAPNFNVQPGGGYTPGAEFTPTTIAAPETPQLSQFESGLQNVMNDPMKFVKDNPWDVGMPVGGALLAGLEPSDLYGKPLKGPSDKYDPYATLNLSGNTGLRLFAEGGSITTGGIRDIYGNPDDQANGAILSQDGYGLGRLNELYGGGNVTEMADGGAVGGDSINLNTVNALDVEEPSRNLMHMGWAGIPYNRNQDSRFGGLPAMASAANPFMARLLGLMNAERGTPETGLNLISGQQETRYVAKGGYLDGAGDGMSDSIPATIEDKQPARLADGEFVVPADVVSHIGNGSSKAGAKRLYAMLDKVRTARTGTKKQGKEINPNKYLPA